MTDYISIGWLVLDFGLLVVAGIFYYFYIADRIYVSRLRKERHQLENQISVLQKPVEEVKAQKDKEWEERTNRALAELDDKHNRELSEKVAVINNLTLQMKELEGKNHDLSLQISSFNSAVDKAKEEFKKAMEKETNEIYRGVEEFLIDFYDKEYTELEAELTQSYEDFAKLQEDFSQTKKDMQKKIDALEKEKQNALADKALAERDLREYKEATAKVIGAIPEKKAKHKISESSLANLKNVNKQNREQGET